MTHRTLPRRRLRSVIAGRGFMLLPAAAYAVHEGRYLIGYGSQASQALAAQGHGYLDSLAPWVALLLALGFGAFLVRVARAASGRAEAGPRRNPAGLWFLTWMGLLAIYTAQEWLEGLFAAGHPGGLGGIFGHGGGWAIPLSAVAALVVTALLQVSAAVVTVVSSRALVVVGTRWVPLLRRPVAVFPVRRPPLADARAGRAPPVRLAAVSA